ncbi:histidine phosphatase superfamily [Lasiosphaeris hirsuta]|uniref:3-phytase n=1 Tax=Lasiosphaeris hirsuta TaxID=260670 RepID=A0AA40EAL4_9PEZI|nr:histidine phosphatase superfamily [Lasiosphaeris hirsuta]
MGAAVPFKNRAPAYEPIALFDMETETETNGGSSSTPVRRFSVSPSRMRTFVTCTLAFTLALVLCLGLGFLSADGTMLTGMAMGGAKLAQVLGQNSSDCSCQPEKVPQYFQTSPELWAGPTATGRAPFMAQTRTFATGTGVTYVPNAPLQTDIPIVGSDGGSIFDLMAYLSPYTPSPGFGVQEYPLPEGAEIVQLQMLSRHGSRYPTTGSNVVNLGDRIAAASGSGKPRFKGSLEFLNDWKYQLGAEILVPKGRQELFDSGVLHNYMYSQLVNPNSKIIVRTTTQDRMLKSAEYFMAGFFGLEWTRNATIEVIIEENHFNNSLAGYLNCPNSNKIRGGSEDATAWIGTYLQNASDRFAAMVDGYEWTLEDTYGAQTMCPYETVAYGFSRFCDLFTYEEWVGFGYSVDLSFYGDFSFGSPTGRAMGIGYQQEVLARLRNHTLGYSGSQINVTLDNNTETFPLNQSVYLDFSHDTNIISILTAFGLKQFASPLDPSAHPGEHNFTVSHLTPFGARLDIEIIRTPKPLAADRSSYLESGSSGEKKYVHFVLNQRTIPLGLSFPECDASRVDGWCEFDTFLQVQEEMPGLARYDYACFGDFPIGPTAAYTNGAPP